MNATFQSGLHLHTLYGDGRNSPEEMILAAIDHNFFSVGISEHAYASYDPPSCCIPMEKMMAYRDELRALKEKYAERIEVYSGLEVDAFYLHNKADWDFVIGSAHYVKGRTGCLYSVDHSHETLLEAIADAGNGSAEEMVRQYAESVAVLAETYRPDILGHIDVITKLNADGRYFNEESDWYLAMWEDIIRRIAATGSIAEMNSGAVSRGYRSNPYPALSLLRILRGYNVPMTVSSDAHAAEDIVCAYPEMTALLKEAGYHSVKMMRSGQFVDYPI